MFGYCLYWYYQYLGSWLTSKESFCCFLDVYSGMECLGDTVSLL